MLDMETYKVSGVCVEGSESDTGGSNCIGKTVVVITVIGIWGVDSAPVCPFCGNRMHRNGKYRKTAYGKLPKDFIDSESMQTAMEHHNQRCNRNGELQNILNDEMLTDYPKIFVVEQWLCPECKKLQKSQYTHIELPPFLVGHYIKTTDTMLDELSECLDEIGGESALVDKNMRKYRTATYIRECLGTLFGGFVRFVESLRIQYPIHYILYLRKKKCYTVGTT